HWILSTSPTVCSSDLERNQERNQERELPIARETDSRGVGPGGNLRGGHVSRWRAATSRRPRTPANTRARPSRMPRTCNARLPLRSEEHTSELQTRANL